MLLPLLHVSAPILRHLQGAHSSIHDVSLTDLIRNCELPEDSAETCRSGNNILNIFAY
jgi:hypothetical protein